MTRTQMIRKASSLPKGSPERRSLLERIIADKTAGGHPKVGYEKIKQMVVRKTPWTIYLTQPPFACMVEEETGIPRKNQYYSTDGEHWTKNSAHLIPASVRREALRMVRAREAAEG